MSSPDPRTKTTRGDHRHPPRGATSDDAPSADSPLRGLSYDTQTARTAVPGGPVQLKPDGPGVRPLAYYSEGDRPGVGSLVSTDLDLDDGPLDAPEVEREPAPVAETEAPPKAKPAPDPAHINVSDADKRFALTARALSEELAAAGARVRAGAAPLPFGGDPRALRQALLDYTHHLETLHEAIAGHEVVARIGSPRGLFFRDLNEHLAAVVHACGKALLGASFSVKGAMNMGHTIHDPRVHAYYEGLKGRCDTLRKQTPHRAKVRVKRPGG